MRIAVVEDEAPIREGMGHILQKINADYELVGTASNGIQGLNLIEKTLPDLVIMDIQMPEMDGLTMLSKLRERKIGCRVIVLTAYSDFNYAKEAIELGVENYLLKPIKLPELTRTLKQIEELVAKENREHKIVTQGYVFRGAIGGHIELDVNLDQAMKEKYGFSIYEPLALLVVWLGDSYAKYQSTVIALLGDFGQKNERFESYLVEMEAQQQFVVVLYHLKEAEELYDYLKKNVLAMLKTNLGDQVVCGFALCNEMQEVPEALKRIDEELEWNLLLGGDALLCHSRIKQLKTLPFKYPLDLENQARHAIMQKDYIGFEKIFRIFIEDCQSEPHTPKEIKEACIRFCWSILNTVKEYEGFRDEELAAQDILTIIMEAVSWEQILTVLISFLKKVLEPETKGEDNTGTLLVQRAKALIREYYNQGITLEESARRLCVSEEYLSSQFKKETGNSFTETVKKYRIEQIKQLLLSSKLKLNQIAAMVGYSDPKYMSKVFREEVGMLPAEYRKLNS